HRLEDQRRLPKPPGRRELHSGPGNPGRLRRGDPLHLSPGGLAAGEGQQLLSFIGAHGHLPMLAMAVWAIEANFISMVERRLESCSFRFISRSSLKLRSRSTLSSWATFFRSSLEDFLSSLSSSCRA